MLGMFSSPAKDLDMPQKYIAGKFAMMAMYNVFFVTYISYEVTVVMTNSSPVGMRFRELTER